MHPLNENDNLFQRITFKVVRRFIDLWFGLFSSKARRLNNELFSDIRILTEQEWELFAGKIKAYSEAREYKPDYTNSWLNHGYRLYLSIKWIEDIIRENDIHDAMDLGEGTPFTDLLREYFPGITWSNSQGDLRYRWELQDESMDLIICTELLEHLSDLPDGLNDSFRMTGLRAALKECHRVLKTEGWLFITTPNSVSMLNIERILLGNPAWFFPLHVREYEPGELLVELKKSGFTIHNWRTVHCLTAGEKKDYTWLYQLMLASGYPVQDRGDDIFVVARKS